ncbi:hypothetical protein ACRRTK_019978 [Alexandromys fortis]
MQLQEQPPKGQQRDATAALLQGTGAPLPDSSSGSASAGSLSGEAGDFVNYNDEVEETNNLNATAAGFDPFLTSSSDSKNLASESSRCLTEEQQQMTEWNKQLALERRQAKLLSNSQSLENGVLMSTPWAQTVGESSTGEDQEDSNGLNTDTADAPHVPSANTKEKEQFDAEEPL